MASGLTVATTGKARSSVLPNAPTSSEAGVPGYDAEAWYGLFAPAKTSPDIVDRLNKELLALVNTDEVKKRIHAEGGDPMTSSPGEYTADIDQEERKWGALIKKLNLKVE